MLRNLFVSIFLSRFNLPRDVHRYAFRKFSDRIMLQTANKSFTYGEFEDRSFKLVQAFKALGLKKGDIVFTQIQSAQELFEIRTASLDSGVLLTSFNGAHSAELITKAMQKLNPKLFILDADMGDDIEGKISAINPILPIWDTGKDSRYETKLLENKPILSEEDLYPSDPMALGFTSGTTGEPKGLITSQRAAISSLKLLAKNVEYQSRSQRKNINLTAIPLVGAGSGLIMPTLLSGGTLVLLEKYSPEHLVATVKKYAVTRLFVTPSQLIDLLEMPPEVDADLASLTHVIYGTAPMPVAKLEEALLRFGPIFQQGYGQAEILPPVSMLKSSDHMQDGIVNDRRVLSSCGRVVDGVNVKIVGSNQEVLPRDSVGEVYVHTPTRFETYLDPTQNKGVIFEDGFFRTGDHGYIDEGGYLHILDRKPDLISVEGGIIYPRLIEEEAHDHPAVRECCLVAPKGKPVLCVSIRQNSLAEDKTSINSEILTLLSSRLAVWQMPQQILFVNEIPRSLLGKVLRREVREKIAANLIAE